LLSFLAAPEANLGKRDKLEKALCRIASLAFNEATHQPNECRRHGIRWGNIPDSLAVIAKIAAKGLQGTCRRSYLNFAR
jgi:hypothetical protein